VRSICLGILAACGHAAAPTSPDLATLGAPGLKAIDPARLEAMTKYLASDELGGRAPGSEGGIKAEDYVAKQFADIGLVPAGERGTYFQTVPMREATRVDAKTSLVIHAKGGDVELVEGKDMVLSADPRRADVLITAPLVFVGYGFTAPGYDDLTGVDLHGAIAIVFGGAPRAIAGKPIDAAEHAVLADTKKRTLALRDHGASAVIVVFDPARAARMPYENYITKTLASQMAWLEHGEPGSLPVLPVGSIGEAGLDRVLAVAGAGIKARELWEQLDHGTPMKVDLQAMANLRVHAELADRTTRNVLGLLRGTDPNEIVVYTAHVDHLGFGPPIEGDKIYNGALDDALGVAGIIEIARAFKALPHPPRRSILFLAVTGEEKGLLGSDYYVKHPLFPLDHTVADINIDGLFPLYEGFDMLVLGAEHSTLAHNAEEAARASGFVISPDPDPDQVYFIRSDQYSFVQKGIPSAFPNVGWRDAHGDTKTNKALADAWGGQHYHQPSDEWLPGFRAQWAAKEAGFDFLFGLSVANAAERPTWNPGDAFATLH
jgi:hypothetical protein